jgi:predicted ArsR family transcriptional regulator
MRSAEGYMADWRPVSVDEFLFFENHCPICAAAKSCQGFCRSELEIFRTALGDGVTVEREEHIVTGARRCTYRISALKA